MGNKSQGLALSAVIAAGLLLRPAMQSIEPRQQPAETPPAVAGLGQSSGQGPWIASCDYWAPVRQPEGTKDHPEIHEKLDASAGVVDLSVKVDQSSKDKELACPSTARWGFPEDPDAARVRLTTIIATVPDPVHSHFALLFDRAISSILQAASDNGYVSSYYWLPWKYHSGVLRTAESLSAVDPAHDPEREREPGLIVLKRVPNASEKEFGPEASFYNVVYLFLVGETPTQGVNGFQVRRALSYEKELENALPWGSFFRGPTSDSSDGCERTAIIGPMFSGSAASLRAALDSLKGDTAFQVAGTTVTKMAARELNINQRITYKSFADNTEFERGVLTELLSQAGYDLTRVAVLVEDNTALGKASVQLSSDTNAERMVQEIRFPREISLLRNAQVAYDHPGSEAPSAPSPFLHFSLRDSGAHDSVPQFSPENTPVSQEAQLMAIGRELHRFRSQFIAIVASNVLDQIFLAQFLHRACPEARLVFIGADLLMVREIDNVPFIGSISVTPYGLMGLGRTSGSPRAFPDSLSQALYNAASYTFWHNPLNPKAPPAPILQGYRGLIGSSNLTQPSQWATVIGSDGYYPLAILSPHASNDPDILPPQPKNEKEQRLSVPLFPSRLWVSLCALVALVSLVHTLALRLANFRSLFTRDLAVDDNDQERRRSTYIHVAAAALCSMAIILSVPALALASASIIHLNTPSTVASVVLLLIGFLSCAMTLWKTRHHIAPPSCPLDPERIYWWLNLLVWSTGIALAAIWIYLCFTGSAGAPGDSTLSYVGLSFSYRCVNPGSGVSPVVPVLLLLLGWYVWAFCQTWRLRFSDYGRPRIPARTEDVIDNLLFVADDDLDDSRGPRNSGLYKRITSLLTIREQWQEWSRRERAKAARQPEMEVCCTHHKSHPDRSAPIDIALGLTYIVLAVWFCLFIPVRSVDHFLWRMGPLSSPFELVVAALFFPLLILCLSGCLRMVLIWTALRRDLLQRLENQPIRFAFSRLRVMGWMTMLRHGGLQEHWMDMARSLESMRQMLHDKELQKTVGDDHWRELDEQIRDFFQGKSIKLAEFPKNIEKKFAAFSHQLLTALLIPYWKNERVGLVASQDIGDLPIKARRSEEHLDHSSMSLHAGPAREEPAAILVAEEFLAIRYISLIRAVLSNMRYLMIFISASFVLAIAAWNSYPFQPRQRLDWFFTGLLLLLGAAIIWVFAQMHRDPILSRITATKANELGWDFYLRIISFGILPVLAWLTYQFPDIGSIVYKFFQPGVPVVK